MKLIIHAGRFDNGKPVCGAKDNLTSLDYTCKRCDAALNPPTKDYDCYTNTNCGRNNCVAHGGHGADS